MTREEAVMVATHLRFIYFPLHPAIQDAPACSGRHLAWMVEEMERGLSEGKTMRWLGYIQGVLVTLGIAPLEDMKAFSRTKSIEELSKVDAERKNRIIMGED